MPESIREVMTKDPTTVPADATLVDAARVMRDEDIGDVIVVENDRVVGIATDRDVVIRGIAEERDPQQTRISQVCSSDLVTLSPEDSVDEAVRIMRERALRRLPIVEDDQPVGIVSIGDLAVDRQPDSALAEISTAEPNE